MINKCHYRCRPLGHFCLGSLALCVHLLLYMSLENVTLIILQFCLFLLHAGKKVSVADDNVADFLQDVTEEILPTAVITM